MRRFLFNVASIVSLLSCLLALVVLAAGFMRSLAGEVAMADYVAAGALAVVPYCFAGTLHRMLGKGSEAAPSEAPPTA